jgi:15-cis-phytoene synthase
MTIEASLAACEETVRRVDPDRYLSALFAPTERRPLLFALYAFNHELARIGETVREPMIADIRFEWWREALEGARDGRPRAHDVVRGLAEVFARSGPPLELFEPLVAARRFDIGPEAFADLAALEAYADATSGGLMRIAASLLDETPRDDALFRHAGVAYALTGLLRAGPFHAVRGKSYLPRDLNEEGENAAVAAVLARARFHYSAARALPKPGHVLPAVLPAALVPLYARRVEANSLSADIPLYRRQWAMLMAAMRGRV